MHLRRTVVIAAALSALSISAGAFEVFDPVNTLEHSFLNGWRDSIGALLTLQLDQVRQMAKRLSLYTSLGKYVAPDPPPWATRRIDGALQASNGFMDALNGGDRTGQGVASPGPAFQWDRPCRRSRKRTSLRRTRSVPP